MGGRCGVAESGDPRRCPGCGGSFLMILSLIGFATGFPYTERIARRPLCRPRSGLTHLWDTQTCTETLLKINNKRVSNNQGPNVDHR